MITRRETGKMLLAAAAATAVPKALSAKEREDFADALQRRLRESTLEGSGTSLSLVGLDLMETSSDVAASAVVRMDWPPGLRIRPFSVSTHGMETAFDALFRVIVTEFGRVNPCGVSASA